MTRRSAGALARLALTCLYLAAALPSTSSAQTNTNTAHKRPPENRYLLIVETSRSLHGRLDGTLRTVYGLVGSGMRGQMRQGDELGVWTYNDSLYTGQLGVQDYYKDERGEIAKRVVAFLQAQSFEKRGKLDNVVPAILHVVKASEFITVVLVSGGNDEIRGTPFDEQINTSFKMWRAHQQESKMPFVTVLRGSHGVLTGFSVAPIPWPVEFPPLPAELQAAKKPPVHSPSEAPKPAPRLAQPLIISGRKPKPAPAKTKLEPATLSAAPTAAEAKPPAESPTNPATVTPAIETAPLVAPPLPSKAASEAVEPTEAAKSASAPAQNLPAKPQTEVITASAAPTPDSQQQVANSAGPSPSSESVPQPNSRTEPQTLSAPRSEVPPYGEAQLDGSATSGKGSEPVLIGGFFYGALVTCLVVGGVVGGILLWLKSRRARPASHISLITRSLERNGP